MEIKESYMTEEYCPYCNDEVKLPPFLGIYECPNCGKLIVACSMCENLNCTMCKYRELLDAQ